MALKFYPSSKTAKNLFLTELSSALDKSNPLYILRNLLDDDILQQISKKYDSINKKEGRPKNDGLLMLKLFILQAIYGISDNATAKFFKENLYFQYFCGFEYFEPSYSLSETCILRFRKKLGENGMKELLKYALQIAISNNLTKEIDLENIAIDTTVQEKNIKYPTDVSLLNKARTELVKIYKKYSVKLNDTYEKIFAETTDNINFNYKSDSKSKTKFKHIKKLKVRLGRLCRQFEKKILAQKIVLDSTDNENFKTILSIHNQSCLGKKGLEKYKETNKYIYSFHEPAVECIAKGKAHKKYEFGNKVSMATSVNSNFVLSIESLHGNPYDGHTLAKTIEDVEKNTNVTVKKCVVDRGYKGNDFANKRKIYMTRSKRKNISAEDQKLIKRRNAIEPIFGHLKEYFRMGRNYLAGVIGDILNSLRAAIGFNFKKIYREFILQT